MLQCWSQCRAHSRRWHRPTPRPQLIVIAVRETSEELIKLRQSESCRLLRCWLGRSHINVRTVVLSTTRNYYYKLSRQDCLYPPARPPKRCPWHDIVILACPPPPKPSIPARSRSALAAQPLPVHSHKPCAWRDVTSSQSDLLYMDYYKNIIIMPFSLEERWEHLTKTENKVGNVTWVNGPSQTSNKWLKVISSAISWTQRVTATPWRQMAG